MKPLSRTEASIEAAFLRQCKKRGWRARKMNGEGFRDWPDRLVLGAPCGPFWVEFKRPGKLPTPSQDAMHEWLAEKGELVWVADEWESVVLWAEDSFGRDRAGCAGGFLRTDGIRESIRRREKRGG